MRSFMKEGVNTREKENFRRFVQALLNVVGKEEYHSILQVCYERATEMSDRNTEVKTLGHFVSDFETKKNSYKDLGKGLLNVISRSNKHLTELDLSYCTSLGPHHLFLDGTTAGQEAGAEHANWPNSRPRRLRR